MRLKAVLFDLIGTTIFEKNGDVINACFRKAFNDHQVAFDETLFNANRGKNKKLMVDEMLTKQDLSLTLTQPIYQSFVKHTENSVDNFYSNEHAPEIFRLLKSKQIRIGIGSGLPSFLFTKIVQHVQWNMKDFDYIGISDDLGKSRPDPIMIFDMMKKLAIADARSVLKIGDTVADIQEGKNAGAITAALLSGTQSEQLLAAQHPDYLLKSLSELPSVLPLLN